MTPIRRLAGAGLAALALVAGTAVPAGAHASAAITIHWDGTGSLWITTRWADGHPITGPVTAIVTAVASTGHRVGPAPLRSLNDGTGTLAYAGQLAPGRWSVTAEMASPAVARCEAQVAIGPGAAAPGSGTAGEPAAVTCQPENAAAASADDGGPSPWWLLLLLLLIPGLFAWRRLRARR